MPPFTFEFVSSQPTAPRSELHIRSVLSVPPAKM
jgi:hypothetical protein